GGTVLCNRRGGGCEAPNRPENEPRNTLSRPMTASAPELRCARKKSGPPARGSTDRKLPRRSLFNCFYDSFECFGFVHCQIGQNLAVQPDAFGVEFPDEFRVGHSLHADGGVDARDPQAAERPLLELAVCIGIRQTLFDRVFGDGPYISP